MNITRFKNENGRLIYQYDCETVWIEAWGKNSIRVRATKLAHIPEENWALIDKDEYLVENAKILITEHGAHIENDGIRATMTPYGKLTIFNLHGAMILNEYVRTTQDSKAEHVSVLGIEAREFRPTLGGDYQVTLRLESLNPDERIYGMGQYQQTNLNLKGTELELAQRNSQASVPFAVSSLGYGFLWNNPGIGRVTFGKNITTWQAESSDFIDYWITVGDTPAEILKAYSTVTGFVPMMPEFALGFWQSKLRYQTQEELLEVAREYRRRNLPISVIVADYFHWPTQGDWRFDATYWPDPDAMICELNDLDIELMVSVWPTVDNRSENFVEMMEKGLLIRTERGLRIGMDFQGNTIHLDVTNPEARNYIWEKVKKNYYDKGVNTFWLDVAEPEYTVYDFDNYRYFLGRNVKVGNIYPLFYAKTFFDGMNAEGRTDVINLVRCAWAGSQRYGALVWSGDVHSNFASLRNQLVAGLNMGMAGIPWWTTDIGGFLGGNPEDPEFRQLFVRWFEWGTFCPVMRLHGDRDPKKPQFGTTGGCLCLSGADNEVWSYGEQVYEVCRRYLKIRENIKPYLRNQMRIAHLEGTPVMRPIFFDFHDDIQSFNCEDEYMFGSDLLVAPVMKKDEISRDVYLPLGSDWKDVWTETIYNGGQKLTIEAPLDKIPLFCRTDAVMDLAGMILGRPSQ